MKDLGVDRATRERLRELSRLPTYRAAWVADAQSTAHELEKLPRGSEVAYSVARAPVIRTISTWSTNLIRRSRGTDAPAGPA